MYVPLFVFFYLLLIGAVVSCPSEIAWGIGIAFYFKLLKWSQ
jgi:hypothetical protein